MSLLMDALRRAEEEKKQAARNKQINESLENLGSDANAAGDDEDLGATVKLDRLPLAMGNNTKSEIHSKQTSLDDLKSNIVDSLNDLSVDFESTSPRLRIEEQAETINPAASDETFDFSIHSAEPLSLEPLVEDSASDKDGENNKTSTQPSGRITSDTPGRKTHSRNIDPLLGATQAESTLEITNGQTAATANTVFEAGSSGISRRIIVWTVALGVALFSLLLISGVYYFQQAPTTRTLPSPVASVELEKARSASVAPSESTTSSIEQPDAAAEPGLSPLAEDSKLEPVTPAMDAVSVDQPENLAFESAPRSTSSAVANEGLESALQIPTEEKLSSVVQAQENRASVTPTVDTERLKIARSLRASQSNEQVIAAYSAYRRGEYDLAKSLYMRALEIRPQDVNALNGLAALALRDGDKEYAHELYSRALKLDPNNPTATTAIFQIEGGVGTRVSESRLKLMLESGGDPGLINFALGNLYSKHQRWNDAQLAFFEAVKHRPDNADYLFNLAVSLDQMGQRKAAREYYQKAVSAMDERAAGFNPADALARIQAIGQNDQ